MTDRVAEFQAPKIKLRDLAHQFWSLARPYWTSDQKWQGLGLLALVVALSLAVVYMTVQVNAWYNDFYTALQNYDVPAFWAAQKRFAILAFFYIIFAVHGTYFRQMLEVKWRKWLTEHFQQKWLQDQRYYRLQLTDAATDNPDQRIAEDVRDFVGASLSLSVDLLRSVVSLVSFVGVLWTLSGALSFTLAGHAVSIPGYMVWVAVVYALIGTVLTFFIGRPLIGLNFLQQRFEADFRYSLVRLRENAESIALYRGEGEESKRLDLRLGRIVQNYWQLMRMQKRLGSFTSFWGQLAIIFPFFVAGPRYLAKEFALGQLMQISSTFGRVYDALQFIIDSFGTLATWKAVIDRLYTFDLGIAKAATLPVLPVADREQGLALANVSVRKPDGETVIADFSLDLIAGDRLLIQGRSGCGKSMFLRTLAGIWPFAAGDVAYPHHPDTLFLSQRPYLPLGTLREALSYPHAAIEDNERLQQVLATMQLSYLVSRLDDTDQWAHVLSWGEQQRIALARALLHRPAVLVLDEATSAIDEATEAAVYQAVIDALPEGVIISVAHRSTLKAFHDRVLNCHGDGHWALA
ncbi:putative ATP-binding cassette transporter [Andreprevotia lacus DSM 23236]|jgi:putative ATP-binding cassette transporter|uniref:Putative ATP-binding cassette transporter n=1 Tax=Andreprevotia lacus DSM 23236 TaxID=1121001 RepID=A0A1W1WZ09_9NEIS|nr:ABC transporter ATP-binding protein/permease [Andreprevotia lacus]SMC16966.1 putative ATP-binding cassette transporter [Andreprevotia lacus DSM 23236]